MNAQPFFLPWIGPHYESGVAGVRLLLLGKSHYGPPSAEYPEFTWDIVKRQLTDGGEPFFTKTKALVLAAAGISSSTLWDSVAFYNYIQRVVGETSDTKPSREMWSDAVGAFEHVLHDLRPDGVLVLSKDVWVHLGRRFSSGTTSESTTGGDLIRKWTFGTGLSVIATPINHPTASHGWSQAKWEPKVKKFLEVVRDQKSSAG